MCRAVSCFSQKFWTLSRPALLKLGACFSLLWAVYSLIDISVTGVMWLNYSWTCGSHYAFTLYVLFCSYIPIQNAATYFSRGSFLISIVSLQIFLSLTKSRIAQFTFEVFTFFYVYISTSKITAATGQTLTPSGTAIIHRPSWIRLSSKSKHHSLSPQSVVSLYLHFPRSYRFL